MRAAAALPRGASLADWTAAQTGAAIAPRDLDSVIKALSSASVRIANALARAGVDGNLGGAEEGDGAAAAALGRDAPKKLDVVAVREERERVREGGVIPSCVLIETTPPSPSTHTLFPPPIKHRTTS